jgi:hypothetical protein
MAPGRDEEGGDPVRLKRRCADRIEENPAPLDYLGVRSYSRPR